MGVNYYSLMWTKLSAGTVCEALSIILEGMYSKSEGYPEEKKSNRFGKQWKSRQNSTLVSLKRDDLFCKICKSLIKRCKFLPHTPVVLGKKRNNL